MVPGNGEGESLAPRNSDLTFHSSNGSAELLCLSGGDNLVGLTPPTELHDKRGIADLRTISTRGLNVGSDARMLLGLRQIDADFYLSLFTSTTQPVPFLPLPSPPLFRSLSRLRVGSLVLLFSSAQSLP